MAYELGYSDVTHFSRDFRRITGMRRRVPIDRNCKSEFTVALLMKLSEKLKVRSLVPNLCLGMHVY
ncbi:AraC family transcriptional regulator [Bathymodiolus platifrons methanotrophic gill symbiont]|uniref:AraC family transcriptional regulator n=1 Tax=Bathymodiolus platifrons methanotrophic gill symbiont TaxID=113268 RepID=UPI0011CCA419